MDFLTNLKKKSFKNTIRVANSLDPDQTRCFAGPDMVAIVCKGYQQTTKTATSGKEEYLMIILVYISA